MANERKADEDEFWAVALSSEQSRFEFSDGNNDIDYDDDEETCDRRTSIYRLQSPRIDFHLSSLPELSGAWSPVGAQIWHASAVLACLPFNFDHVNTVLEIGSGAVGLSGLILAARMNEKSKSIILSDMEEDGILDQLQSNVDVNTSRLRGDNQVNLAQVCVESLDWREIKAIDKLPSLDLIVGSELVYTAETSKACASLINNLLAKNVQASVAIVQVFDRPGWSEFLALMYNKNIDIIQPLPPEWHDRASELLCKEALGTLSRDDYGLCLIGNLQANLDCVLLNES